MNPSSDTVTISEAYVKAWHFRKSAKSEGLEAFKKWALG